MADDENKELPPPPPSPEQEGGADYQEEGYAPEGQESYDDEPIQEASGPAVASGANKNAILILVGAVLGVFVLYQLFSGDDEPAPPPTTSASSSASEGGGASIPDAGTIEFPSDPIIPPQPLPQPPPINNEPDILPPLQPPLPDDIRLDFSGDGPANEEQQRRRASEMLILSQPGQSKDEDEDAETKTTAERAVATKVGDLSTLVLQGKVLSVVLESALDTTLPGPLRAVVSHDVYAESGYGVLIPKGSRLIGTYNTDIVRGQGRVFIIWNRLIRPDGVDIQINSQAIDLLGRSGAVGFVDSRYFEIFGSAILTSMLTIGVAAGADALFDTGSVTETTNTDGSTTSTGTPTAQAALEAAENIGSTATRVAGQLMDVRPSISLDQGTPIKVFVNRDLEFPEETTGTKVRMIQ